MSMGTQPCTACGEETATGSAFYFDRRVVERTRGGPAFVCSSCVALAAKGRRGRQLTDDEVRRFVQNGSMAFLAMSPGSH